MQPNRNRSQPNKREPSFTVQDEIRRDRHLRRVAKMQKKRRVTHRFTAVLLCTVIGVLLLCAVAVAATRIETVTVRGNVRYAEADILEAADFGSLSALVFLNGTSLEKKIRSACPYVETVQVEKLYPNALTLTVTETKAVYTLALHDSMWLLDNDLRVVDANKATDGLTELVLPSVQRVNTGSALVFSDAEEGQMVSEVLADLVGKDNPLSLGKLVLTDRYHIYGITADGTCKILFGDRKNLSRKVVLAKKLMADAAADSSARTLVDVSSLSGPTVTRDYEGAF